MDLAGITALLEQSLNHTQAKQAEQALRAQENAQSDFAVRLLHVVASTSVQPTIRLAASLFFKNLIRRRWTDEEGHHGLPESEVATLKTEIVGLMISLPPNLQVQIGEAVSIMADSDFPERWPSLIDDLVGRLSPTDMVTNNGVLTVAHSIFKRWRPLFRSDALYLEIQLVLNKFAEPFLKLYQQTDKLIGENESNKANLEVLFQTLLLILKIYFDLNCQDIPEYFEDNLDPLMELNHKYLVYNNPLLIDQDDDETAGILDKVKAAIFELLQLYVQKYDDVSGKVVPKFVETSWHLLTQIGPQTKYDILVSKALGYLTSVANTSTHAGLFFDKSIVEEIIKKVILPNIALRPSDEELFEDDPIEYTRRDTEGSDNETRRNATTTFLRVLNEKNQDTVTSVVSFYIEQYVKEYNSNRQANWRSKDTAVYLFQAIATKGNVTASGITSTNPLVDVVSFFTQNIAPDLVLMESSPFLKVDAIRYILTFRNQLTKEQLLEAFNLISNFLLSDEYAIYTSTAITIERILSMRQHQSHSPLPLFDSSDIAPVAHRLLQNLFSLIERGTTPEKLSENEFLMKCVMRVLLTAKSTIVPYSDEVLGHLTKIIQEISKNPSNPRFSHYAFESLSTVIRYISNDKPLGFFDSSVVPIMLQFLSEDVVEFAPYAFQILAQILELTPANSGMSPSFHALVRPLLSPNLWDVKGNAPALVRLLKSIISHEASVFVETNNVVPLLGVFQKLISSRVNDNHGFDLLKTMFLYFSLEVLQPYTKQVAILFLQRLQTSRTEKFVIQLSVFIYLLAGKPKPGLNPEYVVSFFDQAQNNIFGDILQSFIFPCTPGILSPPDRKVATIGLTTLLTESPSLISGKYASKWHSGLSALIKVVQNEEMLSSNSAAVAADEAVLMENADMEDLSFGASFVKLHASISKEPDPFANIDDIHKFVISHLQASAPQIAPQLQQLPNAEKQNLVKLGISL